MPDIGVERHLRGLSEETKTALGTILDIEHADTDVTLPSMREIDDEETEFQTLKAERKLALADEQAKTKAARVSIRDEYGRSGATGKRKTAIARVTIWPGIGDMSCNKLHLDDAFPDIDHRGWMIKPFLVTNTMGLFDVKAIVTGGGRAARRRRCDTASRKRCSCTVRISHPTRSACAIAHTRTTRDYYLCPYTTP